jgi:superfamily II helicase
MMYRNLYMLFDTIYSILNLKKGIKMNVDKCKTCNYCGYTTRKGSVVVNHEYVCALCGKYICADVPFERCRYSKREVVINSKMLSNKRLHKV